MEVDPSPESPAESEGRSAIPNLLAELSSGSSLYEYFVNAETKDAAEALTSEGSVKSDLTYSIGLRNGYKWQVTAGIRRKSDKVLIMSDSYVLTAAELETASSKNLMLKPADGNGKIDLSISVDSSVTAVQILFDDSAVQSLWDSAVLSGGEISTSRIYLPSIKAGVYYSTINFLDTNGIILFSVEQAINVFPGGIATEKWVAGTSGGVIEGGVFNLSSSLLNTSARNVFYVTAESTKIIDSTDAKGASDANEGSAYRPLPSISKAIEKINAGGDSSKKYTIYVKGTVIDNPVINCSNIASLLITNVPGSEAVIDGNNSTASPVVTVSTTKTVTMTNIKITKGNCHGLHLQANAVVKLGKGVVIAGNSTPSTVGKVNGGGVCMESNSELYMYDDAIVGQKTLPAGTTYSNRATAFGGGIYCNGGKIYMGYKDSSTPDKAFTGGVYNNLAGQQGAGIYTDGNALMYFYRGGINNNTANNTGGGIRLGGTDTLNMYGGTISNNTAGTSQGGGVYIGNGSTFNMKGGEISSNTSTIGGGIANNLGIFSFTGGKISSNSAVASNKNNGGAIYSKAGTIKIGGSAYVPFDSANGNIIYLDNENSDGSGNLPNFVITSSLTPPSECTDGIIAVIKPYTYTIGQTVLTASGGVTLSDEVSKFGVLDQVVSDKTYNWKILEDGKLTCIASAGNAADVIAGMSKSGTVVISGSISREAFDAIATNLKALPTGVEVTLDMSGLDIAKAGVSSKVGLPSTTFRGCTNLVSVILPDNLEDIEGSAFENCSALESIVIPASVTRIEMSAFENCSGLTTIKFRGSESAWESVTKNMDWNKNCPTTMSIIFNYED